MKIIFIGVVLLLCSCTPKAVPLAYDCPVVTLPPLPALQTRALTTKTPDDVRAKAYVIDLKECRGWVNIVKKQVAATNQKSS